MKNIIILMLCLISAVSYGQKKVIYIGNTNDINHYKGQITADSGYIFNFIDSNHIKLIATGAGGDSVAFQVSSLPQIGDVIPESTPGTALKLMFAKTQVPTASISGGQALELRSAGSTSYSLSWTVGRQLATDSLTKVWVAGIQQSFTQPTQPGTYSGTQNITLTNNASTIYYVMDTTTDNKTASASTQFTSYTKYYYGFASSSLNQSTITDAQILAALSGANDNSSKLHGPITVSNSSDNRFFIVIASSIDPSFTMHILEGASNSDLTSNYNHTSRSFTNALGGTYTVNIWAASTTTSSSKIFTIQ